METSEGSVFETLEKLRAGTLVADTDAVAARTRFQAEVDALRVGFTEWVSALLQLDRAIEAAKSRIHESLRPNYEALAQTGARSTRALAEEWTREAHKLAKESLPDFDRVFGGQGLRDQVLAFVEQRSGLGAPMFSDAESSLRALAECWERYDQAAHLLKVPETAYFKDEVIVEKVADHYKLVDPARLFGLAAERFEALRAQYLAASTLLDDTSLDGPTRARAAGLSTDVSCPKCLETLTVFASVCRSCRNPVPGHPEQLAAFEARVEEALALTRDRREALRPLLGGGGPGGWEAFCGRAKALAGTLEQERQEEKRRAEEQARLEAEEKRRGEEARRDAAAQARSDVLRRLAREKGFSVLRLQLDVEISGASELQLSGPAFARLGDKPAEEAYVQSTLLRVALPCNTLELALPAGEAPLRLTLRSARGTSLAQDVVLSYGPGLSTASVRYSATHLDVQSGQASARVGRVTGAASALATRVGVPALAPAIGALLALAWLALGLGAFLSAALHWSLARPPASDLLVDAAPEPTRAG
ncbi:MAG: hypothetical protein RL653_1852 [Pseudomonadota bacterium]|jgi:hypothetical protein